MMVYYFVPFIVSNRYLLLWVSNCHNSVTVQNRTHVYMNFFDHKDLGNHLLQLCPKVVKHPVYILFVSCLVTLTDVNFDVSLHGWLFYRSWVLWYHNHQYFVYCRPYPAYSWHREGRWSYYYLVINILLVFFYSLLQLSPLYTVSSHIILPY